MGKAKVRGRKRKPDELSASAPTKLTSAVVVLGLAAIVGDVLMTASSRSRHSSTPTRWGSLVDCWSLVASRVL